MTTAFLVDAAGWIGAAAVLLAYGLVSLNRVRPSSRWYQLFNMVGAVLLAVNTVYHRAFPSAFVNVLWLAVALYALARVPPSSEDLARSQNLD